MSVDLAPLTDRVAQQLRETLRGRVISPGDEDYDAVRQVVPGGIDHRPALIARPADAADVSRVVDAARESGIPLAVRSGGHSGAAHGTVDGGLVLDVRDLKTIQVDAERSTAWVDAGATAAEVAAAVTEHGLVVGFGDTGSVGVSGLTTGGGIGYLVRKHGLTIDSLLAADVVTADGQLRRADERNHRDLFWAIRGGGGNFGVVTRLQFRLHRLPSIVGGVLVLPATADTVAAFVSAAESASEDLSTIGNVMPAPPMPFLPESAHGQLVIFAIVCHAGPPELGDEAIAPFRAIATPLADLVRPMTYPELFPPEDDSYHPTAVARTMFVDRIDLDVARTIMAHLSASDAAMRVAQLRPLGGAMARVPVDDTAFAHRASRHMINVAAFYEGEADRAVRQQWVDEFVAALQQDDRGAYVNFLTDEGPERVRAAYPGAHWERLREIKARYDPDNLFRRNQNIPPAER